MPRKPMDKQDWADLTRHIHNQGIGELETKGLTEEEENRQMKKTFQEITELGYPHIHTVIAIIDALIGGGLGIALLGSASQAAHAGAFN